MAFGDSTNVLRNGSHSDGRCRATGISLTDRERARAQIAGRRTSFAAALFRLLFGGVLFIVSYGTAWCDPTADLWTAIGKGDVAAARAAIEAGADVNAKDRFGETPLLIAAREGGNKDLVVLLIAKGADVNAKNQFGETPLFKVDDHVDTAALLITRGANVNARSASGKTPLFIATRFGNRDVFALLIAKGASLKATDQSGNTLLHAAAEGGNKDLVALLIAKGADVNAQNQQYGDTPLFRAAGLGRKDAATLLIAAGAHVNAKNSIGETPLHVAASEGYEDIVALLIAKGANVNVKDKLYGRTPLFDAARSKNGYDLVQLLVAKGAILDVKGTDKSGDTLLHAAAEGGNKDLVALLIAKGANVNVVDKAGWTPLHYASKPVATLLIAKGADASKALAPDPFFSGLKAAHAGNWNEAIKDFIKARDSAPGKPEVYFNLALAFEKLGRSSPAAICFEAYLALAPNAANKGQVRGEITRLTAQAQAQMKAVFRSAVTLAASANNPRDYVAVAENFARAGELSKALQYGALAARMGGGWSNPDSREVGLRRDYAAALYELGLQHEVFEQATYIERHFALSDEQKKDLRSTGDEKDRPWYAIENALQSYEREPISFETAVRRSQEVESYTEHNMDLSGKGHLVVWKLSKLGSRLGQELLVLRIVQKIWQESPQCRDPNNYKDC